ncbi:MAG: 30S ribosomal protein S6e [Candidatus Woesearchaeota archaeon]
MAEFKLNIGDPKTKKILKKDLKDAETKPLIGKRIGDKIKGEILELPGYEFEITGGSDNAGFPMRRDVLGSQRKKVLIVSGVGIRKNRDGNRRRITVAGNTIYDGTVQINMKVVKHGKTPLFEEPKEEASEETKAEDTAAEQPTEEKKEE